MTDSVIVPVALDTPIAVDNVGGIRHQLVKVEFGDTDSATQVSASNPLPVTLANTGSAQPVTQSGTWTVQPGNTANTTAWKVDASSVAVPITDNSGSLTVDNGGTFAVQASGSTSSASGGIASTSRLLSAAASTNSTSVKGSSGRIYSIQCYNAATTIRYLKLYNKATAPTIGSDTPVKTIPLPPSTGMILDWANIGYYFATGIGFGLTTGSADADTGALTSGDVLGLGIDYV